MRYYNVLLWLFFNPLLSLLIHGATQQVLLLSDFRFRKVLRHRCWADINSRTSQTGEMTVQCR